MDMYAPLLPLSETADFCADGIHPEGGACKVIAAETAKRLHAADRAEPDAETLAQARRYRDSLPSRPGWDHAVETAVVEVYGDLGYRWFPVAD